MLIEINVPSLSHVITQQLIHFNIISQLVSQTGAGGRWTKYCDNNNALFIAVHVYKTQKPQFSDKTNKRYTQKNRKYHHHNQNKFLTEETDEAADTAEYIT